MTDPSDLAAVIQQWTALADADLAAAERLLAAKDDALLAIVCFHAQQSAEKDMKALLTANSLRFAKTHDLILLAKLIPPSIHLPIPLDELGRLSLYAVDFRYPEPPDDATTMADATSAVLTARTVRDAVRSALFSDL